MKRNPISLRNETDENLKAAHRELEIWLVPFAGACAAIDFAVASSAKPLRDALYGNGVEKSRKSLLRPVYFDQ